MIRMGNAIVERERELAAAARLLDRARVREGGALLLEGPADIGKTAVLDQAARLATDFRVLRGAGGEIPRELTFGLVRDLIEPLLRAAPTARRRRLLAGAAAPAEALLGQGPPGAVDEASIVYGLYWLLSGLAEERPVLLLADDLHWSDRPSLRFLVYLARRLPGLPVAVLAAARPPQLGHSGPLAELAASDGVEALALEPLSAEATATLVMERSPSPRTRHSRGPATRPQAETLCSCASCSRPSARSGWTPTRRVRRAWRHSPGRDCAGRSSAGSLASRRPPTRWLAPSR